MKHARGRVPGARAGAAIGDVVLVLAALALAAAMVYPEIRARAFERHLDGVFGEVEALRAAADGIRADTGTWPPTSPPEDLVAGVGSSDGTAGALPAASAPETSASGVADDPTIYRLEWRRLEMADLPEPLSSAEAAVPEDLDDADMAPPAPTLHHLGLLSVHTVDDATLEALLNRYGTTRSFVHDTIWTLVLPRTPAPAR